MGLLGKATCRVHLIFAPDQNSQEKNECATTKDNLRAYYPNINTVTYAIIGGRRNLARKDIA
jgi:hypothetical protein